MLSFMDFFLSLLGGGITTTIVLFAAALVIFRIIVMALLAVFKKAMEKTKTKLDDKILADISRVLNFFIIILSAYLSVWLVYGQVSVFDIPLATVFIVITILLAGYTVTKVVDTSLEWYEQEIAPTTDMKFDEEYMPLIRNIVRITLLLLTVLVALSYLGIDITPALAGLGIAGLAVGLALQDTLANFFAGIYLLADRPVRIGDDIKVVGEEGRVEEVGWRSTRLITWDNRLVVLPNKLLTEQVIVNYSRPTRPVKHVIEIGVAYGSDLEKVEQIILKAIKEVQKTDSRMNPKEEPSIRLAKFGDYAIIFNALFFVNNYSQRFGAASSIMKKIYKEFQKEGISIPFPTHTIHFAGKQEKIKEKNKTKIRKTRTRKSAR